jgi:hypothetical protein
MEVTRFGREGWLSRRNEVRADLSVLRTEDVPLEEVSGVCLRREAGGDMGLVAFGDRTSVAAYVELPDDDRGRYRWRTVDLADVDGSLIPRDDPHAKEKDPPASIEFGPAGDAPSGFHGGIALDGGDGWPTDHGDHLFVALAHRSPSKKLEANCADFSDLEVGPDRRLYLLSDKSQSIARLGDLVPGDPVARADEVWKLPRLDGKPEGLALTRNGRAIVALDTKQARDNLVLLEPPIADRRPA